MGIYLIHCGSRESLNLFRNKGFVGVKPKKPSDDLKSRQATLSDNYKIVVQLQVVKPKDILFLYADGFIYGMYRAETRFMEHPSTPEEYQCKHLRFSFPEPCWRTAPVFSESDFFWQLGISQMNGKCFAEGYDTREKFTLQHKDKKWNLPGRFEFEEKWVLSKLTQEEARELVSILSGKNNAPMEKVLPAKMLRNFKKVRLEINLDKHSLLEDEKILESWLIEHSVFNGFNLRNYRNIKKALGSAFHPEWSLPSFYLGIIEALSFVTEDLRHSLQIIDIKKGFLGRKSFLPLMRKVIDYMHKVAQNICQNDVSRVHVTFIAKGFHPSFYNYLSVRKKVEPGNPIKLVKYDVVGKRIVLSRIN